MDYYQILGVSKNSTNYQIETAYKIKISEVNLDHNQRRLINDAYTTLIDPIKRRDYDSINNNMKVRSVSTSNSSKEEVFSFNTKIITIPKWKIYLTLFGILVLALLVVALLIWGFIELLPIIIFIIVLVFLFKAIKQIRGK